MAGKTEREVALEVENAKLAAELVKKKRELAELKRRVRR
jgi:hypothetical protein